MKTFKKWIWPVLLLIIGIVFMVIGTMANLIGRAHASEREDTALWLAMSCVGEIGWQGAETGECAAVMWVYRKGAAKNGRTLLRQTRMYSAAVKRGPHSRPWVFGLGRDGARPEHWPRHLKWSRYKDSWIETLALADSFLRGEIEDPLPSAEHYGCELDRHRLSPKAWARIPAPGFVNWYYARR
jgi:hypothetical protein